MADEPREKPGVVLEVDFKPRPHEDVEPLMRLRRRYHTPGCSHTFLDEHACVVNEQLRRVTCGGCGEALDPIEVLIDMASRWERYRNNLEMLAADVQRRSEHLEQLKREEANARARLKRLRTGEGDG